MAYEYYVKIASEEHMLYASEIANLYGIKTLANDPHTKLVTAILEAYAREQDIDLSEIYYYARYPNRVYPVSFYYPAIQWFREQVSNSTRRDYYVFYNGKGFNFRPLEP
jgi:hypothetical protein